MEQEQQLLNKSSREGEERIERTRKTEWAIKKDQPEFCVVNVFSKLEVTGIYRPHERYVGDFQSKKYCYEIKLYHQVERVKTLSV